MMSYTGRISSIVEVLKSRGLDKWSNDLSEVKNAMMFDLPDFSTKRERPPLHGLKNRPEHIPYDPKTPQFEDGELVIQLNPATMTEELMMWDAKRRKLVPRNEIKNMIDKGTMREERVLDQYRDAPPNLQKEIKPLIDIIQEKRTFSNMPQGEVGIPYSLRSKMAYISDCLEKRGYTILVKKLNAAMEEYSKSMS